MPRTKDNPTAIPLPSNAKVWYDPTVASEETSPLPQQQQPETTPIAHFESAPPQSHELGINNWLDVNAHYVVYAVKNGLVRVLDRRSPNRTLLRGHTHSKVSDIQFFQSGDVLGTCGGNVLIWRIYEHPAGSSNGGNGGNSSNADLQAEKLLEIPATLGVTRIVWHPHNPNQFWILHPQKGAGTSTTMVATLVETTRIATAPSCETTGSETSHVMCQLYQPHIVMKGAIQIDSGSSILDLAWSGRDPRHILTTHQDGSIQLWDMEHPQKSSPHGGGDVVHPTCLATLSSHNNNNNNEDGNTGGGVQRCFFLPHDDTSNSTTTSSSSSLNLTAPFVTGSHSNARVTLWSPFTTSGDERLPQPLSEFCMDKASASPLGYNLAPCFGGTPVMDGPPASFLLLSDRSQGRIYALSLKSKWSPDKRAIVEGWNYVVPLTTLHPIYSWSLTCAPAQHVDDDDDDDDDDNDEEEHGGGSGGGGDSPHTPPMIDMHLYAVQSRAVQLLTLTHAMCIPPLQTYSRDIEVECGIRVEDIRVATATTLSQAEKKNINGNNDVAVAGDNLEYADFEDYDEEEEEEIPLPPPDEAAAAMTVNGNHTTSSTTTAEGDDESTSNSPFANWLGSIVSGSSGNSGSGGTTTTTITPKVVEDVTSSLPYPSEDSLPPPPPPTPNVVNPVPPPGLPPVIPPLPEADSGISRTGSGFLSPMELLGSSSSGGGGVPSSSNTTTTTTTTSPFAAAAATTRKISPPTTANNNVVPVVVKEDTKKNNTKKKTSPRSRSPKPKKGKPLHTTTNNNGSSGGNPKHNPPPMPIPSADGKIAILKRDTGAVPALSSSSSNSAANTTTTTTSPTSTGGGGGGMSASDMESVLGKALHIHFKKYESTMRDAIQRSVRSEVQNTVLPTLSKTIAQTMEQSVVKPLQTSMKTYAKESTKVRTEQVVEAVSASVEQPLQAAFQESMKTVMIPAYDSATREMFSQISSSLDQGLVLSSTRSDSSAKLLVEMASKLDSMSRQMDALSTEVTNLKSQISESAAAAATTGAAPNVQNLAPQAAGGTAAAGGVGGADKTQMIRDEIMFLLSTRSYEAAFTKALSASTAEMAVFCCKNANMGDVFGSTSSSGSGPTLLSQPILLCLMQQLGAVLGSSPENDLQTELDWLQEIALTLDTSNESIQRHVPSVLQQLVANINAKMSQGDPMLRRPLQMLLQVIRGMQ